MSGMDETTNIPIDIERGGGHPVLSDEDEIEAAFTARNALEALDMEAQHRVLTWLAEGRDLAPPMIRRT